MNQTDKETRGTVASLASMADEVDALTENCRFLVMLNTDIT